MLGRMRSARDVVGGTEPAVSCLPALRRDCRLRAKPSGSPANGGSDQVVTHRLVRWRTGAWSPGTPKRGWPRRWALIAPRSADGNAEHSYPNPGNVLTSPACSASPWNGWTFCSGHSLPRTRWPERDLWRGIRFTQ